jgi:hypothetical protein
MPEFMMDKEGTVNGVTFADLCSFTQGYVEAMLFTENCPGESMVDWADPEVQHRVNEGQADGNIPCDAGWGDIHPTTAERLQIDCFNFEAEAGPLLRKAYARDYDATQAGRDFWFTRNGHGVGFWDRTELDADGLGEALSDIARTYGETWSGFEPDPESPTGYGFVHLS